MTNKGPAIGIFRQYAYHGVNRTIHSLDNLKPTRITLMTVLKFGGTQCIRTNEGYVIPLDIINGLPYLKMQPHTDTEWNAPCDSYWR
jgi:hypothetical protein